MLQFSNPAFLTVRGTNILTAKMDFMFNATLEHHQKKKKKSCTSQKYQEEYKGEISKFSYLQNKLFPENIAQTPPEPHCLNCRRINYAQIFVPWMLTSTLRCSQASAVYEASTSPNEQSPPRSILEEIRNVTLK